METTTTPTSPQLDYALPRPWHQRFRSRRFVLGLLVLAVGVGAVVSLPWMWRRAQLMYWHRQCLTYDPPNDFIVFEGRPERAKELIAKDPRYAPAGTGASVIAEAWARFYNASGGSFRAEATVFLHERRTPKGEKRLVVVDLIDTLVHHGPDPSDLVEDYLTPVTRVFTVGSFLRLPVQLRTTSLHQVGGTLVWRETLIGPRDQTRVYAGQPDANDPSHFTIEVEHDDGARRTLDGWLRDDDTVVIESRD